MYNQYQEVVCGVFSAWAMAWALCRSRDGEFGVVRTPQ